MVEGLPIAKPIADALETALEQGVVHRDLKPANVKVRPDDTVKVLDFGLARAMEPVGALSASASMVPTITTPAMTQAGEHRFTAGREGTWNADGAIVFVAGSTIPLTRVSAAGGTAGAVTSIKGSSTTSNAITTASCPICPVGRATSGTVS